MSAAPEIAISELVAAPTQKPLAQSSAWQSIFAQLIIAGSQTTSFHGLQIWCGIGHSPVNSREKSYNSRLSAFREASRSIAVSISALGRFDGTPSGSSRPWV